MSDEQPGSGQGATDAGGLFDSYLQSVPDEHRATVESYLQDASRQVNTKLEEAASLRNTYEPFTHVDGLQNYQPDELQQLIGWHQQVTSDPSQMRAFIKNAAEAEGLTVQEQEALEHAADDLTLDQVRQLAQEMANAQIAPIAERVAGFEQQQWVSTESTLIDQKIAELEKQHNLKLDDDQKARVLQIAESMADEDASLQNGKDWVTPGMELYLQVLAEGAKGFVSDKSSQPDPALKGTGATPVFELPKTWEEARERAREQLRKSRT